MPEFGAALILEFVPGTTGSGAQRTTALDHEIIDYPVKIETVIESALRKIHEIGDRDWRLLRV